jgi:DNA recombination protein RmuC
LLQSSSFVHILQRIIYDQFMKTILTNDVLFTAGEWPVRLFHGLAAAAALAAIVVAFLAASIILANRNRRREARVAAQRQSELDDRLGIIQQANAELTGRLATLSEVLTARQSDLARFMAERLDSVGTRVGQGLESHRSATVENLAKLNERLAVIDSAQARLTGLTQEVVGLKDILANKQSRGAFGQGRMEAIIRDGLPANAYEFQATLSNGTRPDCIIRLPSDDRAMVVDAKFPLEAFTAFKDAKTDDQKRTAVQRVKTDINRHIKDIAERYLLPGETQDLAVLFVPSESVYADLNEFFDDLIQKAHRARIIIVSPSLLMMAIQVMQAIVRDAVMRQQAHLIQSEVRKIVDDVGRLRDRIEKLDQHFRQAQDCVTQIGTSAEKIVRRGQRIDALEFDDVAPSALAPAAPVKLRRVAE